MFRKSSAMLVALAILGSTAVSGTAQVLGSVGAAFRSPELPRPIKFDPRFVGGKGARISVAQQKRNSRKSKNVRRHKVAMRGRP
jgi:hypothetical protein